MVKFIVRVLVGRPLPYPCGQERIRTIWAALLWRLGSIPGLDASVNGDGSVTLFRRWCVPGYSSRGGIVTGPKGEQIQ